jgi:transposase-like protein
MERRKFTREFKLEAVRLIKERGVSYAQASHDLSVHQSQLRTWVKALADDLERIYPEGAMTALLPRAGPADRLRRPGCQCEPICKVLPIAPSTY